MEAAFQNQLQYKLTLEESGEQSASDVHLQEWGQISE